MKRRTIFTSILLLSFFCNVGCKNQQLHPLQQIAIARETHITLLNTATIAREAGKVSDEQKATILRYSDIVAKTIDEMEASYRQGDTNAYSVAVRLMTLALQELSKEVKSP